MLLSLTLNLRQQKKNTQVYYVNFDYITLVDTEELVCRKVTDVLKKEKCMFRIRISINFFYANWLTEEGISIRIMYLITHQHLSLCDCKFYGLDYDANKGTISLNPEIQCFKMYWNIPSMSIIYVVLPRIYRSTRSYMKFVLNVYQFSWLMQNIIQSWQGNAA